MCRLVNCAAVPRTINPMVNITDQPSNLWCHNHNAVREPGVNESVTACCLVYTYLRAPSIT